MGIRHCRVCKGGLFPDPLLAYSNMPKAAQHFPSADALTSETGVDLEVCQCSHCGLVQLSNEPVPYFREVKRNIYEQLEREFLPLMHAHLRR